MTPKQMVKMLDGQLHDALGQIERLKNQLITARTDYYKEALKEAQGVARGVEEDGVYNGEASVDTSNSIYQQGACEVADELHAILEELDKKEDTP